jgi:hypothetical protein
MVDAALAGAASAAVWAAVQPLTRRLFGTTYSDVQLLGRGVTRTRAWPAVGLAAHLANGAAFGIAFDRAGMRGWKRGVLVAELENLTLWPSMALADRFHPDRRSGSWPPLARNPRVFAESVVTHALFGALLGALLERARPG